jgi:(2Fe-2S) ferredoxin
MINTQKIYLFICINKKIEKKCCALFNSEYIADYLKEKINAKRHLFKNHTHVKVVKTSCLGKCAIGPNIFIIPDNIWYTFSCIEDIDELIDLHFIQGKKATRLVNTKM